MDKVFPKWWLAGIGLFAVMVALNYWLMMPSSPMGIGDHQQAANAAQVNAIQQGWSDGGVLWLAQLSMIIDLIFIGVYTRGALAGGLLFRQSSHAFLRPLGTLVAIAAVTFGVTDYCETFAQFIQAMRFEGSDVLSAIHSGVRPAKTIAFLVTFVGLLTALGIRRMTRPTA